MRTKKLPKKLSAPLRLAVADAKAIEKTPGYVLRMGSWHEPVDTPQGQVCHVCMAGAVLAKTLRFPKHKDWLGSPSSDRDDALFAIDNLRAGFVEQATEDIAIRSKLTDAQLDAVARIQDFLRRKYGARAGDAGRATWRTYLAAANQLEKAGL